jgi:alpha-L-fucosidase
MRLTRFEIVGIVRILEKIVQIGSKSITFKYLSKKIRETLKSESEAIKEVKPVKLLEYQSKIAEVYKECADKNDNNEFKFIAGASENPTIYDLEIKDKNTLGNKIAEINANTNMQEIQEEDIEINKFMQEEIEIELPKLKLKDIPDDLSDIDIEILFKIIEE